MTVICVTMVWVYIGYNQVVFFPRDNSSPAWHQCVSVCCVCAYVHAIRASITMTSRHQLDISACLSVVCVPMSRPFVHQLQ